MSRLRIGVAGVIVGVWVVVCLAAVVNPALIALATLVTPAMLIVAGWLLGSDYLNRRYLREPDNDDR